MNLTRVRFEDCEVRHFLDSLLIESLIPKGASVLDLGTGAGFPAWPLACARPDLEVTALDGSRKPFAFLEAHPLPNLKLRFQRAEACTERESFDFVTGRALAPLSIQLELGAAWVVVEGVVVPFRTPPESDESSEFPAHKLGLQLSAVKLLTVQETDIVRLFPVYTKTRKTPPEFPRPWNKIKASPLRPKKPPGPNLETSEDSADLAPLATSVEPA